jgi:hypothetical protein
VQIPDLTGLKARFKAGFPDTLRIKPLPTISPQDEFLHPPAASGHHSATETSYFGFNIPEHALNAEIYVWFHPVLKMISASVYIWRGLNPTTLAADYVNHYNYLPFPKDGIADYEIEDLGLKIKVLEPLKTIQIDFDDPDRNVDFTLRLEAIMPPGVRPTAKHFTQAMKTSGRLNLYGEELTIDGYFSRDHSWGEERRETSRRMPPMSWMVGVIDETFAFHVVAYDSPEAGPDWAGLFDMPPGDNLMWGYVWRDGQLFPVTKARKLTTREPDGISPRSVSLDFEDGGGARHAFHGEVLARMPWQTWQNMTTQFSLTRWTGERGVAHGDWQDIQMQEYVRRFSR